MSYEPPPPGNYHHWFELLQNFNLCPLEGTLYDEFGMAGEEGVLKFVNKPSATNIKVKIDNYQDPIQWPIENEK